MLLFISFILFCSINMKRIHWISNIEHWRYKRTNAHENSMKRNGDTYISELKLCQTRFGVCFQTSWIYFNPICNILTRFKFALVELLFIFCFSSIRNMYSFNKNNRLNECNFRERNGKKRVGKQTEFFVVFFSLLGLFIEKKTKQNFSSTIRNHIVYNQQKCLFLILFGFLAFFSVVAYGTENIRIFYRYQSNFMLNRTNGRKTKKKKELKKDDVTFTIYKRATYIYNHI